MPDTTFIFEFNLVKVIKSFEAAVKVFAAILACKAVSSLVKEVTLVVSLACSASSASVITVTLATRLASIASAFASSTLRFALSCVKVIKSLAAEVAVIKSEIAIFLV